MRLSCLRFSLRPLLCPAVDTLCDVVLHPFALLRMCVCTCSFVCTCAGEHVGVDFVFMRSNDDAFRGQSAYALPQLYPDKVCVGGVCLCLCHCLCLCLCVIVVESEPSPIDRTSTHTHTHTCTHTRTHTRTPSVSCACDCCQDWPSQFDLSDHRPVVVTLRARLKEKCKDTTTTC